MKIQLVGSGLNGPENEPDGGRRDVRSILVAGWLWLGAGGMAVAVAGEAVAGRERVFDTAGSGEERCIALNRMPGAEYSETDREIEAQFCDIDFYADNVALCPKTWSTSPATIVYDVAETRYDRKAGEFEEEVCPMGGRARSTARLELAIFKVSMNAVDTSATHSKSALLYYHFSRYFRTRVGVPVAVYRSMDRGAHRLRVVDPGIRLTADRDALKMIHAGWLHLRDADLDPANYRNRAELITQDGARVYGVLLLESGRRYGPELNGTRASGWGVGQARDFQRTAPFLALRTAGPLSGAIASGLEQARTDPEMARALGARVDAAQMAFWMQELTEIVLLDFLFDQQDRIGNIDYESRWHWWEDGQFRTRRAANVNVPADIAAFTPVRLRRSRINDNDAGGRRAYVNYAEDTAMLEGLRHFNPGLYQRLARLARDFSERGELYQYVRAGFGLPDSYLEHLAGQISAAFVILADSCEAGDLAFDLEPETFLRDGDAQLRQVDCASGRMLAGSADE